MKTCVSTIKKNQTNNKQTKKNKPRKPPPKASQPTSLPNPNKQKNLKLNIICQLRQCSFSSEMLFYYSVKKDILLCVGIPFVFLLCHSYDGHFFKEIRTIKETNLKYMLENNKFQSNKSRYSEQKLDSKNDSYSITQESEWFVLKENPPTLLCSKD